MSTIELGKTYLYDTGQSTVVYMVDNEHGGMPESGDLVKVMAFAEGSLAEMVLVDILTGKDRGKTAWIFERFLQEPTPGVQAPEPFSEREAQAAEIMRKLTEQPLKVFVWKTSHYGEGGVLVVAAYTVEQARQIARDHFGTSARIGDYALADEPDRVIEQPGLVYEEYHDGTWTMGADL